MRHCLESLVLSEEDREAARRAVRETAYFKWQAASNPEDGALTFWLQAEVEWNEYCYVPDRYPTRANR